MDLKHHESKLTVFYLFFYFLINRSFKLIIGTYNTVTELISNLYIPMEKKIPPLNLSILLFAFKSMHM